MGKVTGFMETGRLTPQRRDKNHRITDWQEVYLKWDESDARKQAGRCMDCGVPFCNSGCPLGNLIPEFNDLIYQGNWEEAIQSLHATNNFPEFTGRICPAPCEASCTLSLNSDPVTIEMIEKQIGDHAWEQGWIKPEPASNKSDKNIAVVGSGPAGMAAAQQLARSGHAVTVFERNEYIGGLLTLGIPEFKLEKSIVDRRIEQMRQEGVDFQVNTNVGIDITHNELLTDYDAVCLSGGATVPRDLPVEGRELKGVHFAMEFLTQQNRKLKGKEFPPEEIIDVKNKKVVIIGGGDTGADCLGTSHRQGAGNIVQMEIMPRPSESRIETNPWPQWPLIYRVDYGHAESAARFGKDPREYSVLSKEFSSDSKGRVTGIKTVRVAWTRGSDGTVSMEEIDGTEEEWKADLILLAMGFTGPEQTLVSQLELEIDQRSNFKAEFGQYATSVDRLFVAGDCRRGQSLVVWAIREGREAAREIDRYLMGATDLA